MDTSGIAADVAETATSAGRGFFGELKKVGKSAFSQLLGNSSDPVVDEKEIAKLKKKDNEFSEAERAAIRAKITEMYLSHDAVKKKEEQLEKEQEEQKREFEKLEKINELRQSGNAVNVNVGTAIGKASAETGRSYGAE